MTQQRFPTSAVDVALSQRPVPLFTGPQASTATLPPGVVERLLQLRERSDTLHRAVVPFAERSEFAQARIATGQFLDRLQAPIREDGYGLEASDPEVVRARQGHDAAVTAEQRLLAQHEAATARWQPAARVLSACEEWLRGLPQNVQIEDAPEPKVALQKGEDLLGGIQRLQRRVRELRSDLHRVNSSPFPSSVAKENARQIIEGLASQAPSITALVEHGQQAIGWPMKSQRVQILNSSERLVGHTEEAPDALAIVCWLHRDALIAALDREIDDEADDAAALTVEQRQVQASQVGGDLLDVERQETELVWRGLSQGLPVEFRQDTSPMAVLGCQLITTVR